MPRHRSLQPARRAGRLIRQTRDKSTDVALGYLRSADLWRNNVAKKLFGSASNDH